jgi:UDP-N-acetylmuramoyl-L-alanyl-D-glutamate--2,6-diaminopimelate ligase
MTVEELNYSKSLVDLLGDPTLTDVSLCITGVAIDSRKIKSGDLFLAYRGAQSNGIDYIEDAIHSGAVAIAIDEDEEINLMSISIPVIKIPNLRKQAGFIISRFYDEPSKELQLIGVTGTNGKTTVSYMIAYALYVLGRQSAVIGTLGYGQFQQLAASTTTTPDPVTLHSLFSSWRDEVAFVAMEVSSHALDQGRVAGTEFDIAVFTNLTRDHLDYHETIENYADAKFQLFESSGLKHAIVNVDDSYGAQLIESLPATLNIVAYSTKHNQPVLKNDDVSFVYCKKIENDGFITKISVESSWGKAVIQTSLLGTFNVDNILAAFATLCVSGFPGAQVAETLSGFAGIPGRMEYFSAEDKPLLVVDYAHTPDALEKALMALRPYCSGNLYCVFGCGGDRDVGKRSQMGAIAERLSDQIVITNDNPRTESPKLIFENILEGFKDKSNVTIKADRSDAITNTFLNANKEDVVLIAGKGHETTQQIGTDLFPFSDRELARRLTEQKS